MDNEEVIMLINALETAKEETADINVINSSPKEIQYIWKYKGVERSNDFILVTQTNKNICLVIFLEMVSDIETYFPIHICDDIIFLITRVISN